MNRFVDLLLSEAEQWLRARPAESYDRSWFRILSQ